MSVDATPRAPLARAAVKAAVIAGGLGWAWGLILIAPGAWSLINRPEHQEPYPVRQLGDAFANVKPIDRELLGPLADRVRGRSVCDSMWFDSDDGALLRGIGPMNGTTAPAWLTLTVGGHVIVGRVTVDLWNGVGMGTGSLECSTNFIVASNLRFVERVPPPRPGPPGWKVIRPGECVLGSTEPLDASGVVGRFLTDLPGHRSVKVGFMPEASGVYIPMAENLTLNGRELSKAHNGERYWTDQDARYELVVSRTDTADAGRPIGSKAQHYTVDVTWDGQITGTCFPPDDRFNCFAEVQP